MGIITAGFVKLLIPFISIGTGIAAYYVFAERMPGVQVDGDTAFPLLLREVVAPAGIAGLVGLALLSYLIEILQPLNARSRDFSDAYANTAGVCIGGALGWIMRMVFAWLWTELHEARIRKTLTQYKPGEVILKEGDRIECFHVVRSGRVSITREEDGEQVEVDVAGPGEPFGLIAEVLEKPQPNTVTAMEPTEVYSLDYDDIEDAIGGHDQPAAKIMRSLARELDTAQEHLAEKDESEENEQVDDSPLA